ncbi:MAG: penicillin-binding protein 2 [Xanthomonadales bacterium]|nr:penicillin-binding protein 2 [Xanthomonadales bacterium]
MLVAVLGLGCCSLVVRAIDLQYLDKAFYQQQGDARFLRDLPMAVSRGMITDRHGEPLAVSSPVESIWVNPQELLPEPDRLGDLAAALAIDEPVLRDRIEQRAEREFVYLRRGMNPDDAQAILALEIPGVYSQREFRRFYPQGEVMAHVLGFTNIDEHGQEGLELAFDSWLAGTEGTKRVIRDRRGHIVENVDLIRAPQPGRDLRLSIDKRLQYLAFRELKHALLENRAASGSVVVLDIRNGEILAMVNQPSYNPNARDGSAVDARRNRAITDVFEPGSVIKTFTVAAALETGRVRPDTQIETSPGFITVGGHTINDIHNYGTVTTTRLLTKSSNVAAIKLAMDMPSEHLHDVLRRFGFGAATGSGFPGEAAGVLTAPQGWGTLEKATISFGYGLSVTALQLAQAYAAIGNGGQMVTPTFLHGTPPQSRAVIDPDIAAQLMAMLETVTGSEGTAKTAAVPGFRTAGKTGTSRRAVAGGYQKRYISSFAGLVPASQPRFAAVVILNDPTGGAYYGGSVAAPVFGRMMEGALRVMDVPPDRVDQWLAAVPPSQTPVSPDAAAEAVPDLPQVMRGRP